MAVPHRHISNRRADIFGRLIKDDYYSDLVIRLYVDVDGRRKEQ